MQKESPEWSRPREICVIGNSHTAAIKQGWELDSFTKPKGVTLTFFAKSNSTMEHVEFHDGKLIPPSEKMAKKVAGTWDQSEIEIARYDAFVLVGLQFGINVAEICGILGTAEDLRFGPVKQVVSERCFSTCLRQDLEQSLAMSFARRIRSVSAKPIVILPVPFPVVEMLGKKNADSHPGFQDGDFLEKLVARCEAAANAVAARDGAHAVWQDEATIERAGFTKTEFGLGAARNKAHNEKEALDWFHRNADFGAIMLARALQRIGELA